MALTSTPHNSEKNAALAAAPAGEQAQAGKKQHSTPSKTKNGGQTTISPPAKVNPPASPPPLILSSGIDTLYLAINITWENENFFNLLAEHKSNASSQNEPQILVIDGSDESDHWVFQVMAHGAKGYEWLIQNNQYTLKIGNWLKPMQRPSVMVEIRSETLWACGPFEAVNQIIGFLENQGAFIHEIKPSRVDLCADILLDENLWTTDLIDYRVTRSSYAALHLTKKKLTGVVIGKGHMMARLYDKPLEIKQKKKKEWMYDIWGISTVPEGKKIIRIEFQLKRQVLNDLGMHHIYDLFNHLHNAWGYCSQKWLKFQDNPGKHHTQRHTLGWWKEVQNGFLGEQKPKPLIRQKAIQEDSDKLLNQAWGLLTSNKALYTGVNNNGDEPVLLMDVVKPLMERYHRNRNTLVDLKEEIKKKSARLSREKLKAQKAMLERSKNGFPSVKPEPHRKAPEPEPEIRQPRRPRLSIDTASVKPDCHRLAGQTRTDEENED